MRSCLLLELFAASTEPFEFRLEVVDVAEAKSTEIYLLVNVSLQLVLALNYRPHSLLQQLDVLTHPNSHKQYLETAAVARNHISHM